MGFRCAARVVLLAMLGLAPIMAGSAVAQSWPSKTIRAVVPLTAGSATDQIGRAVLDPVAAALGQPIIIENRPGAGNTLGMAQVARADADGYTLLVNSSSHSIVPATYANLPFDTLRDLTAVVPLGNMPTVLVVSPSKGYKTLADLVAAGKAKPGAMNYSSAGAGNFSHFATEVFLRAAGFTAVHVPNKGAPEAITEVLAERADFFFSPLLLALSQIRAGKLQALAVSGSQRAAAMPEVPTTAEAGFPGSEYNFWVGVFAPAKTPAPILQRLHAEASKAAKTQAVQERLAKLGVDPMFLSAEAFNKLVLEEVSINAKIANAVGIKAN